MQENKLKDTQVRSLLAQAERGELGASVKLVGDGGALYLHLRNGGAASWIYRFQLHGKRRDYGIGGYPAVSLTDARKTRDRLRRQVKAGIDPLGDRDRAQAEAAAAAEAEAREERIQSATFRAVAEEYIESKRAGWKNGKHHQQWRNTLRDYAHPVVGDLPVADITTDHVLRVLQPIWYDITETASRVQGRIENILDYAKARKYREGENPARWKGHLATMLPAPSKVKQRKYHAGEASENQRALPWQEAPALAAELRRSDAPAARALLLTLLCATRTSETLEARWEEFDLEAGLWTIPAARMKAGKEHRIPLPAAAVEVLRHQAALREREAEHRQQWVFPSPQKRRDAPLSNMAMNMLLRRIEWEDRTSVHGLRSTFRDWVSERTSYPDRLAEVALAHQLSDRVQAAYNRTDQLEKRREMMTAWAQYLEAKPGKVVQLPTGTTA